MRQHTTPPSHGDRSTLHERPRAQRLPCGVAEQGSFHSQFESSREEECAC